MIWCNSTSNKKMDNNKATDVFIFVLFELILYHV